MIVDRIATEEDVTNLKAKLESKEVVLTKDNIAINETTFEPFVVVERVLYKIDDLGLLEILEPPADDEQS